MLIKEVLLADKRGDMKFQFLVSWLIICASVTCIGIHATYIEYDLGDIWSQPEYETRAALRQLQANLEQGEKQRLPLALGFDAARFDDEHDTEYFSTESWGTLTKESPVLVALVLTHDPNTNALQSINIYRAFNFISWLTAIKDYGNKDYVDDPITHAPLKSDDIYFFDLSRDTFSFVCTLKQLVAHNPTGESLRNLFIQKAGTDEDDLKNATDQIERIRIENDEVKPMLLRESDFAEALRHPTSPETQTQKESEEELQEKRKKARELFAKRKAQEPGQNIQSALGTFHQQLSALSKIV